jgi:predicted permease
MINLRLAFRTLFKTPFVTGIAIVSLALGIGANAAIFSLFNAVLLRSLPVPEAGMLVNMANPGPKPGSQSCGNAGGCDVVFSYPMFRDLQKAQEVFTGIAAHRGFGANLAYEGQTATGEGLLVSGSYFPVLGLQPAIGRLIDHNDDQAVGQSPVVVLSHAYWVTRFNANPAVLNQSMIVNGQSLTIVGVAPRGFSGTTLGTDPKVFVPITLRGLMEPGFKQFDNRRSYWVYLFARLKSGTSIDTARTAINGPYRNIVNDVEAPLQRGMSDQTMAQFRAKQIVLEPGPQGQSLLIGRVTEPLTLLLGVTVLVLIIASANIANLLLARAASRANEIAIRLSLGAGRAQLIVQLLTESCLLAAMGGIAGLLVARWTLSAMASILPEREAMLIPVELSGTMAAFAAAVTLGTGLLFGLFPALHSTRPDVLPALKGQAGQPAGARTARRFRNTLATAQIALSMALLVAAGLFTKSLYNVARTDLGLDVRNLVTFTISPELNAYTVERTRVLFERLEQELAAQPGVSSVSAALVPALGGSNWGTDVAVQGFKSGPDIDSNSRYNEIGPAYFRTMGIPLIAGREFVPSDTLGAPKVAIVNEAFTRKFNLGRDAVGKRMSSGGGGAELDTEIVGLVKDAKYSEVKGDIPPLFFSPHRQDERLGFLTFLVRTSVDAESFLPTVRRVVASLDPNLPIGNLRTMEEQARANVYLDRFISMLSAAFAVLATVLAAVGLYGVLAYTVSQRTREIGLRMALGAAPGRVRTMILRQTAIMLLIGGFIGLTAAIWIGSYAQGLLYQMAGHDVSVFAAAAIVLAAIAMVAGLVPAHRAARVDPMTALRYQ